MTLYITIERDRSAPNWREQNPRYRAKIRATPAGPAILTSARNSGSVTLAIREIEDLLGELAWQLIEDQRDPEFQEGLRARAAVDSGKIWLK